MRTFAVLFAIAIFAFSVFPAAIVRADTPAPSITITALCQPVCRGVLMLTAGVIIPAGTLPSGATGISFILSITSPAGFGLDVPSGWAYGSNRNFQAQAPSLVGWTLLLGYPSELWSITGNYTLTATLFYDTSSQYSIPLATASTTFYYTAGTNDTAVIEAQLATLEQQNQALKEQLTQIQNIQASQTNQLTQIQNSVTSGFIAIETTLGTFQSSIGNSTQTIASTLQTLNAKLDDISNTLASIEQVQSEILGAVQSIPHAPDYTTPLIAVLVLIATNLYTVYTARMARKRLAVAERKLEEVKQT